jgi:hypothetical protein
MFATRPKDRGLKHGQGNPQQTFFRMESKAGGQMQDFKACKKSLASVNEMLAR